MSKLIRRKKEIGAALAVVLQLTTLGLIGVIGHFVAGLQHSTKAPATSQTAAAPQGQMKTGHGSSAVDRSTLRASAVFANMLQEPLASQVFDMATARAAAAQNLQRSNGPESPDQPTTLTTDQEDYAPYTYVYFHGTGFQPGETVNMIVVELDPTQESFEPWDVVADENGNFDTSWYIFSEQFIGATLQATATGLSSGLTASATFTDANPQQIFLLGAQLPNAVLPGNTVSYGPTATTSVRVKFGGNDNPCSLTLSVPDLPAGATATFSPNPVTVSGNNPPDQFSLLTISTTAAVAGGTYAFTITGTNGAGCQGTGPSPAPVGTLVVGCTEMAYIANFSDNNVSVINTSTNTVVATIPTGPLGQGPFGVAVSPGGNRVYVTDFFGPFNNVSVINTSTNTVVATIPVGASPRGIAVTPDGSRVYVTNTGGNSVSVINTATNTVVSTVTVGSGPWGVAVTPDGSRVYVANLNNNSVSVINTSTNTVLATVAVGTTAKGVAESPDGTRVYVTNNGGNSVSVINTATNAVVATVPVGPGPYGVAVSPDGTRVYVTNNGSNNVSVINTASNTVVATVPVGVAPTGVAVTQDGSRIYVENDAGGVSIINASTNAVIGTVAVGSSPHVFGKFIGAIPCTPNQPPVAVCKDVTVSAGANCTAPASIDNGSSDPDSGDSITLSQSPPGPYSKGVTAVTLTVTDSHGATASCTANVTVVDTIPPDLHCPANITANNETGICGAHVTYTAPVGTDNCSGVTTEQTAGLASGALFPIGTTTNTFKATDASGHTTTCSFTVTVVDNENPSITCPANVSTGNEPGICGAHVAYTVPVGVDNCPGATTEQTAGLASGALFPVGTTTNTFKVTDGAGHTATCSFTVTVVDNEDPTISCPAPVTVNNDPGICGAHVTYTAPVGTDNCSGATTEQTAGLASGALFPVGTTTNTFKVTDGAGHTATCSFNVTVVDAENPSITCPANVSTGNEPGICGAHVAYTVPVGVDNCPGATTEQTAGLASGALFPVGTTTNTFKVTDGAGHTATCSFTVTVVDVENPSITCPANITANNDPGICGAHVTYSAPVGTDNCPGATTGQIAGLASGALFPVGTTTNTFQVTDGAGHTAACSFTVTVLDNEKPTITCPADVTVNTGPGRTTCDQVATWTEPIPSDNCHVASVTSDHNSGDTFPVGTTAVTYTATDDAGNTSTCSFNVTVVDNTPPVITPCPADKTITATCSALVPDFTIGVVASDNCAGAVTLTQTPAAGSQVGVGDTMVTLHATDAAGNEATCTAHLHVNYNFTGFFQPIDSIPTYNRVKAGQAIPVKFSLGCNQGLNIMATGFPQSGLIACDNHDPVDDIETTVNAGNSSLQYDPVANQYIYVWKTDKQWAGSCRLLNVKLADGTTHTAYFNFTK